MTALRRELTELPDRIARLPVDHRGYPVPWFVALVNGEPEFRAMDPKKWQIAVKTRRCWVCGDPLGAYLWFVLGPMCGINRTTAEPPCHHNCAEWSAVNCPFLSRPHMVRREDELINSSLTANVAGEALTRNPGVTLLWGTKSFSLFDDGKGRPLIHIGDPIHIRWYAEGRPATRAEVVNSIQTGLPKLMEMATAQDKHENDNRAMTALKAIVADFRPLLPPPSANDRPGGLYV
jgi:hypothetical protein